ncbi:prephenate dehydratase [Haloglycomyces albus]|uniref:prephenate dehydratase n=1 Tax=Haloglycomyces albus TaxID=526067 RepID=UPI00046CDEAF|nr:prephenate dehydratase [Haloglycomyces albus]
MDIGYLGPSGTFTEAALHDLPDSERHHPVPMASIPDVLDALHNGEVDAGFVPLENSHEGTVNPTLDRLLHGDPVVITAEVDYPVSFVLATATPNKTVGTIASHPHALAQVRGFLRSSFPEARIIETLSTAAGADAVRKSEADACVCGPHTTEQSDLVIRYHDIGDNPNAATRFVLLRRPTPPAEPTGHDVTSLAVFLRHDQVGALVTVLQQFAERGINLTKIESRPTGEGLGHYTFLLDCTGHLHDARIGDALAGIKRSGAGVRYLGSYERQWLEVPIGPLPGMTDADFAAASTWLEQLRATGHDGDDGQQNSTPSQFV